MDPEIIELRGETIASDNSVRRLAYLIKIEGITHRDALKRSPKRKEAERGK